MARYTGPIWKKSRRLGFSVLENGKELNKRPYAPGQHGQKIHKSTEYGLQLAEKQKVRHMYGINEKQFHNTFNRASKMEGVTGANFLFLLESRLDNVVYRLGFANSIRQARQMVVHGHILVNGKKVDIPSFAVQVGDEVTLREKSRTNVMFKENFENGALKQYPYLAKDMDKFSGVLTRLPERQEVPIEIDEILIVEFYSK